MPLKDLIRKYGIGADQGKVRTIMTNISHGGTVDKMTKMRFTPMRIAVVTCGLNDPVEPKVTMMPPPVVTASTAANGYNATGTNGHSPTSSSSVVVGTASAVVPVVSCSLF